MIEREKNLDAEIDIDLISDPKFDLMAAGFRQEARAPSENGATETADLQSSMQAEVQDLLGLYEREARALGKDSAAGQLYYEMGLLWETILENPRNAAVCFQNAYRLAPKLAANIRSARQLFADAGNWNMVADLLDAELAATTDDSTRLALLLEKANVLEERLGKADDALQALQQCEQMAPNNVSVLLMLETNYSARKNAEGLRDVRIALANIVQDPALAGHYLVAAARICECELKKPAEAAELYRKAFSGMERDPALTAAVKRISDRTNSQGELIAALSAEIAAADGLDTAPLWYQISRVYDWAGEPEKALEALLAGRLVAPKNPLILDELARAFDAAQRWKSLAEVLKTRLEDLTDRNEKVALNLRLGALYEEALDDDDAAIDFYRKVLAIVSAHPAALSALGKLYHKKQKWEALLEILGLELASTDDSRQKAIYTFKSGELLEIRLDRAEEAVARYQECLRIVPNFLPAQRALVRMLERLQRWDDLVAFYDRELAHTKDRDQTVSILSILAQLHEERKNDLNKAAAALRRALEISPDHLPTIRNLARISEKAGFWHDLIRANELQAALVNDSRQIISLLHSNAELFEEQLKDKEKAIEAYEKLLSLSPTYLPALKALGRLYAKEGRWTELVEMYRQEAEITHLPEHAARLLYKAGELLSKKLNRVDEAIAAFQEVLTLSPSHLPALHALSQIYRAQKSWESLVEVLRAEAAARTDDFERANAFFHIAGIWEHELQRPDLAIASYIDVLALSANHKPSFRALERLYSAHESFEELAALLERELQIVILEEEKIAIYHKLAVLYSDRLKAPARAEQCYEHILAADPTHKEALKGLEELRSQDRARRADIRARLADSLSDKRIAAYLHFSAALDRQRLGGSGLPEIKLAAELAPDDLRIADAHAKALRRAKDWTGLVTLLEKRLSASSSPDLQKSVFLRIGEICEWNLQLPENALAAYRQALRIDPKNLAALRGSRRILVRSGDYQEVYNLLVAEGKACHDAKTAIELLLEAGNCAEERLKNSELACSAYQYALAIDPLDTCAAERLEALLVAAGNAASLAELHLRRAAMRVGMEDLAGAADEYVAAAKTYAIDNEVNAFETLDKALELVPDHPSALQARGDLHFTAGRYAEAAEAWSRRAELPGDATELARLNYRLGILLQDRLGDSGRAAAHLHAAFTSDSNNLDALERLAAIHFSAEFWNEAADAYRQLVQATTDETKLLQHLGLYARVLENGFADLLSAAECYKRMLDMAPGNRTIIDKLISLHESMATLPTLAQMLGSQAAVATDAGDLALAESLRIKIAEIHARNSDLVQAIESYRIAVDLAPTHVPARAALADLYGQDQAKTKEAIEEHKTILKLDPFRIQSYRALFRLYGESYQLDRMLCVGHILAFFKALDETENASFFEAKSRAPKDAADILAEKDIELLLEHPGARGVLSELMRIIGDQLQKIYPPDQSTSRADRLKPDNPILKLARNICAVFGVDKFEGYRGHGAEISIENTDPWSLIIGDSLVNKHNLREQRFLLARAALELRNKATVAYRLDRESIADLFGNTARIVIPQFEKLGRADPDAVKRLKKALSGKSIKQLEALAPSIAEVKSFDLVAWMNGSRYSNDRAGLLLCGDISTALELRLQEGLAQGAPQPQNTEQIIEESSKRREIVELISFVISEEHFQIRRKLRMALD